MHGYIFVAEGSWTDKHPPQEVLQRELQKTVPESIVKIPTWNRKSANINIRKQPELRGYTFEKNIADIDQVLTRSGLEVRRCVYGLFSYPPLTDEDNRESLPRAGIFAHISLPAKLATSIVLVMKDLITCVPDYQARYSLRLCYERWFLNVDITSKRADDLTKIHATQALASNFMLPRFEWMDRFGDE